MGPNSAIARPFGYRDPRISCPLSLHVEVAAQSEGEAIPVRGIDISASGIAIAVGDEVELSEAVELAIRCGENELGRIPGRLFYQSHDHYGVEFKFATDEQREQVRNLIRQFLQTI